MSARGDEDRVAERRAAVARLYVCGWTQDALGRRFGVTQQQISHDLKAIRAEWRRVMAEEFDALKAEQLAKLDAAEAEAWRGWRRSLKDAETKYEKSVGGEKAHDESGVTTEGQAGNPRFLEVVVRCVERRCRLIGADAPTKIDFTLEQLQAMTDDQLRAIAEGQPVPFGYASRGSVS